MIYLMFLMGFLSFAAGAMISYLPAAKASAYYMPMWMAVTFFSTLGWALVTKTESDASKLLVLGMYWDTLMQMTYLLLPILIFGARLSLLQSSGVALIFVGLFMVRG